MSIELKNFIRDIPDFPKKGIIYKDITPLLQSKDAFQYTIDLLALPYLGEKIDAVVGIESRGFIFGTVLAHHLGVGFVPIRKFGKLPAATYRETYQLEYGEDIMEIHQDALTRFKKVVLIDDLLATGGTMNAACRLVKHFDSQVVGISFVVELGFLKGRSALSGFPVHNLINY